MDSPRTSAWLIGAVLLIDLAILPWTAHTFDVSVFLAHTDAVFFAHVPPRTSWALGGIMLVVMLLSQFPVLVNVQLWNNLPVRTFLFKLPVFCADLASAAIIRALSGERSAANSWALRYLIDPIVFYVTIFHGQYDALPNMFALAGIGLAIAGRYELAAVALGFGTGTKFYPAAFVPLLTVVAFRHGGVKRALAALGFFAAATAATMLPIVWGKADIFTSELDFYSYGSGGNHVSSSSLWSLVPNAALFPRLEQIVAVGVPLLLAAWELRHRSNARDIARAAMLTAISSFILNPGNHPPLFIWAAGPLVLYAAIADDGLVSLLGIVLSSTAVLIQFCQEDSREYLSLAFGPSPPFAFLRCYAPPVALQFVALVCVVALVAAAFRPSESRRWANVSRNAAGLVALAVFVLFSASIAAGIAAAVPTRGHSTFASMEKNIDTVAIAASRTGTGQCVLSYKAYDAVFFAGNEFAARYANASLGYTLYSPELLTIRGEPTPTKALPSASHNVEIVSINQGLFHITREFDITAKLFPFQIEERMTERPCTLIPGTPLLIYRFDMDAARSALSRSSLADRLKSFARTIETP